MKFRRRPSATKKADFSKNSKSDAAYRAIIRQLYKRDHSEKELKDKLKRYYTDEAIAAALELAHERQYMKAPEALAVQVSEYLHRQSKGIRTINEKLKKRGLPKVEVDADRELDKCIVQLSKKFKSEDILSAAERVKAFRYLTYRGFDSETIKKAISARKGLQTK
jgi:regulatory protein